MSRLTELLRQARRPTSNSATTWRRVRRPKAADLRPGLRAAPARPWSARAHGASGRHAGAPPRVRSQSDQRLWRVGRSGVDGASRPPARTGREDPETQVVITDDLVVVAEFNDRICRAWWRRGVERGGMPFRTVINAENYHALEMLTLGARSMPSISTRRTTPEPRTGSTTTTTSRGRRLPGTASGWRSWSDA